MKILLLSRFTFCFLVIVLFLSNLLSATQINMRDADIRAFSADIAKISNKTIILDPRVKGNVTVISDQDLDPLEAYAVFLSVLRLHGYSAIENNKVVKTQKEKSKIQKFFSMSLSNCIRVSMVSSLSWVSSASFLTKSVVYIVVGTKYFEIAKAKEAVIIKGRNKAYPPVSSAIKKIAVRGAWSIPAIIPAIPTRVKLLTEMGILVITSALIILAKTCPRALPINKEGAKTPPFPPAPKVKLVAITLKKTSPRSKKITVQV